MVGEMPKLATAKIKYQYTTKSGINHFRYHSMGCTEDDSLKTIRDNFENFINGNEANRQFNIVFDSVEIIPDAMN